MKYKIEYKIFPWGMRARDIEKTLKDVEKFVNMPEIVDVISIMNTTFGILVWYKAQKTFKVMLKKP